ncbi:aminodeoxychorismate lyase (4-amino-4-deoxychorismate lyase) (ADC lyase) (ADCL) [[Clostridium] sordellii]|uniref:aminotransferase class IV n=2 Tax=Paraclostridium sordellii TaxID=1505 RepID=UPI0004285785|nr:aminotransferase class IV [Paeniclostridium sordellii]MDU2146393.1 aminotransferase class IV [Paeniclostridium sordellii]CEK37830.1 Aminodeoxychorismate lyase(4-amino-4-deoxychorismate lyase) (ADC lyase) (ADCL) [[Clostridium] sordellii] [Paeniclostridium sordellii]CEN81520.1 aminodeoxychorismate lyase (4-amino-4-deoxychorismate lyase) (ADC lyase) (ADCL) [[Clostridium] sordellii] [Paeniclostridium sordellii]CEO09079.1 aminodeoxychorismate lyase (4-amino-4-deoxychorismate lyase) (ADC lyase) (A
MDIMNNSVSFNSDLCKFGIGLFETIKIKKGKPIYLDMHINRILNSIEELRLNIDIDKKQIINIIENYINEKNIKDKALRLTLFDEGYNITTRDITYDKSSYDRGFKLTVSPIIRGESILHRHKTTNYFENIYSRDYAISKGFNDSIFIDYKNRILECSISNIYFVKDDKIYTPNSNLPILNGTMKKRVKSICEELDIKIIECDIEITEIEKFDFCFVSNSLMEVMKVVQIDSFKFKNYSEVFKSIWEHLQL